MPPVVAAAGAIGSAFSGLGAALAGGGLGALAGTSLISIGGLSLTVGQVALFGASIGLNAVAAQIQKSKLKVAASSLNNAAELSTPQRESNPAQRIAFGRVTTSGAFFFSAVDDPFLYIGLLLAAHEIDAVEAIYINNTLVETDATGDAFTGAYNIGGTSYVRVSTRLGTSAQAIDPVVAADFPSMPATFRQRGHATAVFRLREGSTADQHNTLYGDRLWPRVQFRGIKAYDPRIAVQDVADESTYTWSDNAALLAMRYLTLPQHLGCGVPTSQINWDKVSEAAELCDRYFDTLTGPERSYTANGIVTTDTERYEVIEAFGAAMGGTMILSGRTIYPLPAATREPVCTLHDRLIAGAVSYQPQQARRDRPNVARFEVVRPDSDYQLVAGPVYKDATAIAADGEERTITQRYAFVLGEGNAARAQRLTRFAYDRARLGRSMQMPVFKAPETVRLEAGDVVRVDVAPMPWLAGTYEIKAIVPSTDLSTLNLVLAEWDNAIFAWSPAKEQVWDYDADTLAAA